LSIATSRFALPALGRIPQYQLPEPVITKQLLDQYYRSAEPTTRQLLVSKSK
jgi:hypothetical protein